MTKTPNQVLKEERDRKYSEEALAAQAAAKAEVAKPRDAAVKALVKAGYPEANIQPHWSIARIQQEQLNHEKIEANRARVKAAKSAQAKRNKTADDA